MSKINRNAPCPCGSGLKFKKCCLGKEAAGNPRPLMERLRQTEEELFTILFKQAQEHMGHEGITAAWQAFCGNQDTPLDPETQPEANTSFLSWLLLHWQPGDAQASESIASRYRRRQDHRLPILQRRFIDEACNQPFSFFVVTDLRPGVSITLRDLFWARDIEVFEQKASNLLTRGNILYTQVLPMDEAAIFIGCAPFAIPDAYQVRLIETRDAMAAELGSIDRTALFKAADRLRSCYFEIRNELLNAEQDQPEADPAVAEAAAAATSAAAELTYTLACGVREAFEALRTLSWKLDGDELPADTVMDDQGQPARIVLPVLEKGNRKPSAADNPQLGLIVIEGDRLCITVDDLEQIEPIRRKISRRLGKSAIQQTADA